MSSTGCAARRHECEFRFVLDGVHGDERDFLEVAGFSTYGVACGFEAVERELGSDVFGGKLGAARAGPAAFQQIKRQKAHVRANLFRIDGGGSGTGCSGQTCDGRNSEPCRSKQRNYAQNAERHAQRKADRPVKAQQVLRCA